MARYSKHGSRRRAGVLVVLAAFCAASGASAQNRPGGWQTSPPVYTPAPSPTSSDESLSGTFDFSVTTNGQYVLRWLVTETPHEPKWFVAPRELRMRYRRIDVPGSVKLIMPSVSHRIETGPGQSYQTAESEGTDAVATVPYGPITLAPGTYRFDADPSAGVHFVDGRKVRIWPQTVYLLVPADAGGQRAAIAKLKQRFNGRKIVVKKELRLDSVASVPAGAGEVTNFEDRQCWFSGVSPDLADYSDIGPFSGFAEEVAFTAVADCPELTISTASGYSTFAFRSPSLVDKYLAIDKTH